MRKEVVSDNQAISMIILFVIGTSTIISIGVQAGRDMWLSIIIAVLMSIIIAYMYAQFNRAFQGSDLFDILEYCFGKVIGKLFIAFYIWYALYLAAFTLDNLSGLFFATVGPETPTEIIKILPIILSIMILKEGIEVLGRYSEFFIIIIFILMAIIAILLIPEMKVSRLMPILYNGIEPVLSGTFSTFSFPIANIIIFTMVFSDLKWAKSSNKIYLSGIIISGFILVIVSLINIMILGVLGELYYFSTYITIAKIGFGDFLERIQFSISVIYVFGGIVQFCVCSLAACRGMCRIFNCREYRFIVIPILLLAYSISNILFEGQIERFEWINNVYRFYSFPFQVIIPVLTFIVLKIKLKVDKKKIS